MREFEALGNASLLGESSSLSMAGLTEREQSDHQVEPQVDFPFVST